MTVVEYKDAETLERTITFDFEDLGYYETILYFNDTVPCIRINLEEPIYIILNNIETQNYNLNGKFIFGFDGSNIYFGVRVEEL
jgi:hypothetical protein